MKRAALMNEIFSMTNSTKLILLDDKKYILRVPGKGTDKLINRHQEYEVYKKIMPYMISDEVLYFDEASGIKIARYIDNCHNANPRNSEDVRVAMKAIKHLHDLDLHVDFDFDLKERINFYESLMKSSKYEDYEDVKHLVFNLLDEADKYAGQHCLCHIDPNQDNILISNVDNKVKALVDWEYAAMQDPLLDVAMFAIYANYNKKEIDSLLKTYIDGKCVESDVTVFKYYVYVSAAGLLWSNWCEYKNQLGQFFGGTYEQSQYNYAKTYSKFAEEMLK